MDAVVSPPVVSTGTSLAVLQAYPLGTLEVQLINSSRRGILLGIGTAEAYSFETIVDVDGMRLGLSVTEMLPVLRPFSALCDKLPDGTVPIVEAAKLAMEERHAKLFFRDGYKIKEISGKAWDGEGGEGTVRYAVWGKNTATSLFDVHSDWTCSVQIPGKMWRAFDYLRSQHFAVGLEPHQFIPKTT